MRYLVGFLCVCALGVGPLIGCSEPTGDGGMGGGGGSAGSGGTAGDGGSGGSGGDSGDRECQNDGAPCAAGAGVCQMGSCQGTFSCDEQGIRNAVAACCGPHTFDCQGPTRVITTGEIIIDKHTTLDGLGLITLDANSSHRILSVTPLPSPSARVTLVGFGLREGSATQGGGIYNEGSLVLRDCELGANTAETGGGIWNGGSLIVADGIVRGNAAGFGGGIWSSGLLLLENSSVSGNQAREGGGIWSNGDLAVHGSLVSNNSVYTDAPDFERAAGGGIFAATVSLRESTVSGNIAGHGSGGGIDASTLYMTNSTVSGNGGDGVGGISAGTVIMVNSTVSQNWSEYEVHGLSSSQLTLISSTVLNSTRNTGVLVSVNSMLQGQCDVGLAISGGYNIESPGSTCGFDQQGDQVNVTEAQLNLSELADNGGPTKTHALRLLPTRSVAIDQIPAADCVDAHGALLTEDQRGEPRPAGPDPKQCDVGAFEVQP